MLPSWCWAPVCCAEPCRCKAMLLPTLWLQRSGCSTPIPSVLGRLGTQRRRVQPFVIHASTGLDGNAAISGGRVSYTVSCRQTAQHSCNTSAGQWLRLRARSAAAAGQPSSRLFGHCLPAWARLHVAAAGCHGCWCRGQPSARKGCLSHQQSWRPTAARPFPSLSCQAVMLVGLWYCRAWQSLPPLHR
jgi:hypothetical protein